MYPVTSRTLRAIGERVPVPGYDRAAITPGVVHIGVGGFHRAHQAMYFDRLMNQGEALDWGIVGMGLRPGRTRMREVLEAQDGLYTLVVKHPDGRFEPRVIGSIIGYRHVPDDPEAAVEQLAAEHTRILSLTITEGGYNIHAVTGKFDEHHPDVVADLRPGATPKTTFGLVTEALARRRQRNLPAFTIMSCDNIEANGDVARSSFTAFARLKDADLASWMEANVRFPNSMVDRITPETTDEDRAVLADRFGIDDRWPVVCEPFTQWVLQDTFSAGRPPLAHAGVQIVDDTGPYETMKLRLLNAGHQALGYLGYLAGHRYTDEVTADPAFRAFLRDYLDNEATPSLAPAPGIDLDRYKDELIERFANPQVRDSLSRLCAYSSDRIPKFLLPVVRHNLATGGQIARAAAVVAGWARYDEGVDEQGAPIDVVDPLKDILMANARRQNEDPLAFLDDRDIFGDLHDDERFTAAYREALTSLHERGALATVQAPR